MIEEKTNDEGKPVLVPKIKLNMDRHRAIFQTETFEMRDDNSNDYFELTISKNNKLMKKALKSYFIEKRIKYDNKKYKEALGVVVPTYEFPNSPFAKLFLSEENLTDEIISHECLHIAFAHERIVTRFGMCYNNCDANEERLCYYYNRVYKSVCNQILEMQLIIRRDYSK